MIKRLLELPKNKSLFLFGPRQVGKSSYLKENFSSKNSFYYDLLDSDLYYQLLKRPGLIYEQINKLNKSITHVIIDEIQRVPELLNEVHRIIESKNPRKFILSGSSARKLKREGANMLGARALTYSMYPLTHIELSDDFDLQKSLELGTLPSVYLEEDRTLAIEILKSYVTAYIEQEIKAEAQVRNLSGFLKFLSLSASENGSVIVFSNIASDIGCDYKTVQEFYQILEDTLIGFFLYGYSSSLRKQLRKSPKFYFFDTGVQRALVKKSSTELLVKTKDFGKAFESFFIAELIRIADYLRKDFEYSYYRTKDDAEVDLIVTRPDGKCFAIEIKASDNVKLNKLSGLKSFSEINPSAKLLCASLVKIPSGDEKFEILPWQDVIKIVLG
jgi:uncharacterized protein